MASATTVPPNGEAQLDRPYNMLQILSPSSEALLHPAPHHHTAAIVSAKKFLDPLASSLVDAQDLRKRGNNKKRKRTDPEMDAEASSKAPQLRQVYTEGFGIAQIWEQARRILDSARCEVERDLEVIQSPPIYGGGAEEDSGKTANGVQALSVDESGSESTSDERAADQHDLLDSSLGGESSANEESHLDEAATRLEGSEQGSLHDDDQSSYESADLLRQEEQPQTYVPDPNGLDDGFFSIDDFNKQSQFLEQHDTTGETDDRSDEDEIDWDANPLATPLPPRLGRDERGAGQADSENDGDDGPTFENADLDTVSEEDGDGDVGLEAGMTGLDNTNEVKYADFFEPPPQKLSKSKRMRALPKTQPPPRSNAEERNRNDLDEDVQRAISDVRRDLIDSEEGISDPEGSDEDDVDTNDLLGKSKPSQDKNLSTHEKQVAELTSEIRRLESAAVSKRDWTLSGEARASDRPLNSLIEEHLEFERAGKPVPVITAEVSEEIEALIKRRIMEREFDELVRRRPEAAGAAASMRRGRVEIDDSKPRQGLADIYEADHLKATDPNYVDTRSVALKKQHAEISRLWKDVSAKLDVLSNLHFKPKRTEMNVQVVSDKPTISMEDARPGGGEAEAGIRLAPQEIYIPGEDGKNRREVLGKAGLARNKEEMTREERSRIRRKEKARAKKRRSSDGLAAQQQTGEKKGKKAEKLQEKRNILDDLKKGGVKIIGKRGDVEEIDGRKKKGQQGTEPRSTAYKL